MLPPWCIPKGFTNDLRFIHTRKIECCSGGTYHTPIRSKNACKLKSLIEDIAKPQGLNVGVFRRGLGLEGELIEVNPAYTYLYGYDTEEEMRKVPLPELFEDPEEATEYIKQLRDEGSVGGKQLRLKKKDGTIFWGRITATSIRNEAGNPECYQGIVEDTTERKQAQDKICTSLEEKETLLREIHHRVKNNLQIVSSLLRSQSRQVGDETLKQLLKESENRITSMSIIHEKLYQSENLAAINFKEFIRSLSHTLFRSYGTTNITLKMDIEDMQLPIDTAVPCGLIINELVSNSLKYAFPRGQGGEVDIGLHRIDGGEVELMVSDNGVGMPEDIDIRNTESLGMHLVMILGENQLNGRVDLDRSAGTVFRIRFQGS